MAKRLAGRCGYPAAPNEFRVTFHPDKLDQPLRWREPRRIFVCSMGDLFHPNVETPWIDSILASVAMSPQHTFLALTKRPEKMAPFLSNRHTQGKLTQIQDAWPLPNLHLGVTVCNPSELYKIDILRQTPAAVRFVSAEPLLADLGNLSLDGIHGVILGGETGPHARPMQPDWVRSIRDQCAAAGIPFFFKSWGEYWPHEQMLFEPTRNLSPSIRMIHGGANFPGDIDRWKLGKHRAGRLLDGREHNDLPGVTK